MEIINIPKLRVRFFDRVFACDGAGTVRGLTKAKYLQRARQRISTKNHPQRFSEVPASALYHHLGIDYVGGAYV